MSDKVEFSQLLVHLFELRSRLVNAVITVVLVTAVLLPFANQLYSWIAAPLTESLLAGGGQMIATGVASPFLTPFKLALLSGIFLSMPVLLYQLWAFIAPGLYKEEKKMAFPLLIGSVVLFYLGGLFAYYVVFPLVFTFLVGIAPEGVQVATDIANYLDFAIKMFFAFGVAFQVPIAVILLILVEFVEPKALAAKRPYVIVGAFIIGMLLTPPDVISQSLLAVPMWILFELGIVIGSWLLRSQPQSIKGAEAARHPQNKDTEDFFNENPSEQSEGEDTTNSDSEKDDEQDWEEWEDELDLYTEKTDKKPD